MSDWERYCGDRLVDADTAAALVSDGDHVTIAMGSVWMSPLATSAAIVRRANDLQHLVVDTTLSAFPSFKPHELPHRPIESETFFALGNIERARLADGEPDIGYIPLNPHFIGTKSGERHRDDFTRRHTGADVCVVAVSEPRADGTVGFGHQLWMARVQASRATTLIAEVVEGVAVIPGGDNSFPLDRFDAVVRGGPPVVPFQQEHVPADEIDATGECGRLVASLIDDGDTVMFGGGAMPMRLGPFLADKVDLGCHTELVCPLDLVEGGVITGRRRNISTGKVTATALAPNDQRQHDWLDGNTAFELRDMSANNDPRAIAANDNLVAVNAPAEVSIWGEIGVERVGTRYLRGIGGQVEFILGALMSRGGRSIHAVLSTKHLADGSTASSIVADLAAPGIATVPRHLADFVVTEYGIASLLGKTERERAHALIAVAHPDFRPELLEAARHRFGVGRRTMSLGASHV